MAKNPTETEETHKLCSTEEEIEDEDDEEELDDGWEDWNKDDDGGADDADSDFQCLFCDSHYHSSDVLFAHCNSVHHFDFNGLRKALGLDFYGSFKLINYVRSQVAEHRCWSCGIAFKSSQDLQNHLHETVNFKDIKLVWDDDKYLKPFMEDDSVLYSFGEDEEGEDDLAVSIDKEEILRELISFEDISIDTEDVPEKHVVSSNGHLNIASSSKSYMLNRTATEGVPERNIVSSNGHLNIACSSKKLLLNRTAKDLKDVNENYFGAYSSFGIHREMISDKVRMDAYRQAILKNPSLLKGAVVMDVGCGTGVLSLFAAQAGASRVVAIEASEKMAKVASEIAKNNKLLRGSQNEGDSSATGVIEVVQSMVEEVEKSIQIQPHSVDVLVSEWMGYCLLYETMLNSVLYARDKWLKPGGAILPDTATIFVAGFGKGGTSLPFWENVYGFDMSCIGKELVEDAAKNPIVDVVEDRDIVTSSAVLQAFDLLTMKPDEVDFTASVELEPNMESKTTWCHGVVLWFDTGFTSRFCKESPAVLSTSPFTPRTHWSQTIFTFREPIAIASKHHEAGRSAAVGTETCPATKVQLRISIARAAEYRSIDISLETTGVGQDGRKRNWPVQIFNLQ